jgi:hypothetical protein
MLSALLKKQSSQEEARAQTSPVIGNESFNSRDEPAAARTGTPTETDKQPSKSILLSSHSLGEVASTEFLSENYRDFENRQRRARTMSDLATHFEERSPAKAPVKEAQEDADEEGLDEVAISSLSGSSSKSERNHEDETIFQMDEEGSCVDCHPSHGGTPRGYLGAKTIAFSLSGLGSSFNDASQIGPRFK